MRRKRKDAQEGEFSDPLKDYSEPSYEDDMERAVCEDRVDTVQIKPFVTLDADTTVQQTLRMMHEKNIAWVMITQNDRLAGIFSERDVLYKVADRFDQLKDKPIREVMTPDPVFVYETDSPAKALNMMAHGGFRHVPILDLDEKIVGVLGPRRVTAYLRKHLATQ